MQKKGFTLVETMITVILMVLILTALWRVFSSSQKNAKEIMSNTALNDEMDRTLIKIIDDIREANGVDASYPPVYEQADIANLKTDDENNQLKFIKVNYDFSVTPQDIKAGQINYTKNEIRYYVEKEENDDPNAPVKWLLNRQMIPYNTNKEPIESESTIHNLLSGIDECIFYRINDPDATRSGNIYIKLKMGRRDNSTYSSETVISVKERGAMPEK